MHYISLNTLRNMRFSTFMEKILDNASLNTLETPNPPEHGLEDLADFFDRINRFHKQYHIDPESHSMALLIGNALNHNLGFPLTPAQDEAITFALTKFTEGKVNRLVRSECRNRLSHVFKLEGNSNELMHSENEED
jgi:hypothetical protein